VSAPLPAGTGILRVIASLVPAPRRAEWLAEWKAELAWAAAQERTSTALRLRALSSLSDALWWTSKYWRTGMYFRDLSGAARSLRRRPGLTVAVVFTLALGIAGSTAVFSVVDAVLLRPLPYTDYERLVTVMQRTPEGYGVPSLDPESVETWGAQAPLFERMEAYSSGSAVFTGAGEPRGVGVVAVSAGFFDLLGVSPLRGRVFSRHEEERGERLALVHEDWWRTHLGSNDAILGATVQLDDEAYTVVGVLPRLLRYPHAGIAFYTPIDRYEQRAAVARLAAGVTIAVATEAVARLADRLASERPRDSGWNLRLIPLDSTDRMSAQARTALFMLCGAVLALLLIGCTNAANLLLVHATARRRELAVRSALGASRAGLVRLLMIECMLMAALAALLGLLLAWWGTRVLAVTVPPSYAVLAPGHIGIDLRVLAFAGMLTLLTALAFGAGPALIASRSQTSLAGSDRTATGGRALRRTRDGLAIVELGLAMMLLLSAALLMRSLAGMVTRDVGFEPDQLLVVSIWPPPHRYGSVSGTQAFLDNARERLSAIPGVRAVTLASEVPPVAGFSFGLRLQAEGLMPHPAQPKLVPIPSVDEAYFDVLGIPILEGRAFTPDDLASAPPVAVIDANLARWLWPDGDAVGRRFRLKEESEWITVVGIAADVSQFGAAGAGAPGCEAAACEFEIYRPLPQAARRGQHAIALRLDGAASGVARSAREVVHGIDPATPVQVATAQQRFMERLSEEQFVIALLAVFTTVATLLAGIGVHGVLTYTVARRTREFGLRIALGATADQLLAGVLRESARFAVVGIAIGGAGTLAASGVLRAMIADTATIDPLAVGTAAALLAAVALAAALGPARRAMRISPLEAIRTE
jgi:putative ABC transport system permease protein